MPKTVISPAEDWSIDCGTDKTIVLTEPVYDDLLVPVQSVKVTGANQPDWDTFKDGVYVYTFPNTGNKEVWFQAQFPHRMKTGTDIYPHIHWSPMTASGGSVEWCLEWTWANITGTFGSTATMSASSDTGSAALAHKLTSWSAITPSAAQGGISSILCARLFRNNGKSGELSGDAALLGIDFHYQIDTLGSRQETVK